MPAPTEQACEEFCEAFLAQFPTKPTTDDYNASNTWMRVIDGVPTSGEGCIIEGLPLVDYYDGREPTYLFKVLSKVCDWAHARGWFAELQDPGTVKFYPL